MTESRWPESTAGCETLKQPRGIEVRPGLVGFVARELLVERDQEVRQFAANRSRPKPRRQGGQIHRPVCVPGQLLKASGYAVRSAADGTEALKLIEEHPF